MKLGMEVGLGPGDIVLDGDPAPIPKRGTAPNLWPMSVVAKRLDESKFHLVGRLALPRRHRVRWGPSSCPKKGHSSPPLFAPLPHVYYCDQTAVWIKMELGTEVGLSPGHILCGFYV